MQKIMRGVLFGVLALVVSVFPNANAFASNTKTITYHENSPVAKGGGDGRRMATEVLNVGDRLAGNYPERRSETEQNPDLYGEYRNPGGIRGFLNGYGSGFLDALLGRMGRVYAWNTEPDGSGQWYAGGQTVTADMPDNLDLYLQYSNPTNMLSWTSATGSGTLNRVKPEIYLEGSNNHKTVATAYNVDQSQNLHYKAALDFSAIKNELVVLWGRIGRIDSSRGSITAKFDKRLKFLPEVDISFTSTWLKPIVDPARGILSVETDTLNADSYKIKFDTTKMRVVGDELIADIDVEIIPRIEFKDLTFEKFMQPMVLSVANDYSRGINAIITEESYNEIATSDNPVIKVGGHIKINIQGDASESMRDLTFPIDKAADYQYARLFPTGKLNVDFEDVLTGVKLQESSNPDGDLDESFEKRSFIGRSKHSAYADDDARNYADTYNISTPGIEGYTFIGIKDNDSLTGEFDYRSPKNVTLLYSKNISVEGYATWRGGRLTGSPKLKLKLQRKTPTQDWQDVVNSEVLVGEANYYKWENLLESNPAGEKFEYRLVATDTEQEYSIGYSSENGKLFVDHVFEEKPVEEIKNDVSAPNTGFAQKRENAIFLAVIAGIAVILVVATALAIFFKKRK